MGSAVRRLFPITWLLLLIAINGAGVARALLRGAVAPATVALPPPTANIHRKRVRRRRVGADVYYGVESLDKLKTFTVQRQSLGERRHDDEQERLLAATELATLPSDRQSLELAAQFNEESRLEARYANEEMLKFYYTMKAGMGSQGGAPSCDYLTCGEHATCSMSTGIAVCVCSPCFAGNGLLCRPAACQPTKLLVPVNLLGHTERASDAVVAEIHLTVFAQDYVAVVFREASAGDQGFLMLGHATEGTVRWGRLQNITGVGEPAFGPVIAAFPTGRLLLAYRDADRGGDGYLMGGHAGTEAGNSVPHAVLRAPARFARQQAHRMALVTLATSRAVCLYSDHSTTISKNVSTTHAFGAAMLLQVLNGGALAMLGKYHFADVPVTRLAAVALRPNSFVVAYRGLPVDSLPGSPSQELAAVWVQMREDELVVDTHPIALEPDKVEMTDRDVSQVSQHMFAYSYQSVSEKKTKVAIIRVDPVSHRMSVTGGPLTIANGYTKYVQSVSSPFAPASPHTLTYVQHSQGLGVQPNATAKSCRVSPAGRVTDCKEVGWAGNEASVGSAARLPDGQLLFVFADGAGAPFYQLFANPMIG